MADIVMPRLSDSMEEGIIVQWYVADGDYIEVGQHLAEIETDKATMDYESDLTGTITLIAKEGDVVPLGEVIARVDSEEQKTEEEPAEIPETPAKEAPVPQDSSADKKLPAENISKQTGRINASPVARRIARKSNLPLENIKGSGPNGRILKKDVQAALSQKEAPSATDKEAMSLALEAQQFARSEKAESRQELTRIEEIAARRMSEAMNNIPHFYLQRNIDITELYRARESLRGKVDPLPSLNDFIVRAVAKTLENHPRLRARYEDGTAVIYNDINIGIATSTDEGLMVPVVPGANEKTVGEISLIVRDLAEKARSGTISPAEISGTTFTISNLGMYEIDSFSAIITPGQSGILAIGSAQEEVIPQEGKVQVRWKMNVTLSCDHRLVDGARGALFLQDLANRLESALGAAI